MAYYKSGEAPKSAIINSTFVSRLTSIFGYRVSDKRATEFERKYGLEFVRVDLGNEAYRIRNAEIGSIFEKTPLTSNLEKYFDSYLNDNMISYSDIKERQARLNMLSDMYYNEVYVSRVVELVADEATQLDAQNRILAVESPNLAFTQRCYELFSLWGITAQRIHKVCMDLELYGEAFWANKITPNAGVTKVIPDLYGCFCGTPFWRMPDCNEAGLSIDEAKKCLQCGGLITEGTSICPTCGARITNEVAKSSVRDFRQQFIQLCIFDRFNHKSWKWHRKGN